MSRLDSFIRRLQAQRACLNEAVAQIRGVEGFVLELGRNRFEGTGRALLEDPDVRAHYLGG